MTHFDLGLTLLDAVAFGWFLLCWLCYNTLADHSRWRRHSISHYMSEYRRRWMMTLVQRELRIIDTNIQGNLLQGVVFFASTTILLIGGIFALLGATDRAIDVLSQLPFAGATSVPAWQLKLVVLLTIFFYAFFKFAWSFRLFNYCSILIGGAPLDPADRAATDAFVNGAAQLNSFAARHFNLGIRAYFFAFAAAGWVIHPLFFIAMTLWVVLILYRREFCSRSVALLKEMQQQLADQPPERQRTAAEAVPPPR